MWCFELMTESNNFFNKLILSFIIFAGISSFVSAVSFISPTPANSSYLRTPYLTLNITNNSIGENFSNFTNVTFKIFYSNGTVAGQFPNSTNTTLGNGTFNMTYTFINFTGLGDGNYTYNATFFNGTGTSVVTNTTETRRVIIDTTLPNDSYVNQTPANSTYSVTPYLFINVSAIDLNLANVTFTLFYANGTVAGQFPNNTNVTPGLGNSTTINFTGLGDGNYTFNTTVYDLASNTNSTGSYRYIVDTTVPALSVVSPANKTYANTPYLLVNVSGTDVNYNITVFQLFNSSGLLNTTNVTSNTTNFTNLADGNYTFIVNVTDLAGNRNTTGNYTYVVDTTTPLVSYQGTTPANSSFVSTPYLFVNLSITDATLNQTTFSLFYANGTVAGQFPNVTNVTNGSSGLNFTGLGDGNYTFNTTVYDSTGHKNSTGTYYYVVDTTFPLISYNTATSYLLGTPAANLTSNLTSIYINISANDLNIGNITYRLSWANLTLINATNTTGNFTNFTGLADGNYTYNVTIFDGAGNQNSTSSQNITILNTAPILTSESPSSSTTQLTLTWTTSQPVNTTVFYQGTNVTNNSMITGETVVIGGLSCGTSYFYNYTICNVAGTCVTNSSNYGTKVCPVAVAGAASSGGSSVDTATPTPTPTSNTSEATATPTPSIFPETNTSESTITKVTTTDSNANLHIQQTNGGTTTNLDYQYILKQNVNAGDDIKVEFTGLSCDDYKAGLITFSQKTSSVTCGSVIANFIAQTALKAGSVFKVNVAVKKKLTSGAIQQLSGVKTTIVPATETTTTGGLTPTATPVTTTPASSSSIVIWIVLIALALGVLLFIQFRKK